MTDGYTLRIGGTGFKILSELPVDAGKTCAYLPFLETSADGDCIPVRLTDAPVPAVDLVKTFDSDGAWTMSVDSDGRRFVRNELNGEHLWTAVMAGDCKNVTVHCGSRLVEGGRITSPVRYPLDQILTMYAMAGSGILLHACGAVIDGYGVLFLGKSGAGKSTIARLLSEAENISVLSDDRILVRRNSECRIPGSEFLMHGTPWHGDAGIAVNRSVRFSAMLFLEQAGKNAVHLLDPLQAVERLLPVASIPWHDMDILPRVLEFCDCLSGTIAAGRLEFRPRPGVIDVVREMVSGSRMSNSIS